MPRARVRWSAGCPDPVGCAAVAHRSDAVVRFSLGQLRTGLKPSDPVLQDLSAGFRGFFRVKLAGTGAALPDHRRGLSTTKAHGCRQIRCLAGHRCIGVNEIDPWLFVALRKQRARLLRSQLSPAHVGNPFTLTIRQALDIALEDAEPLCVAFATAFEQQLQAQADPQQRATLLMPAAQR